MGLGSIYAGTDRGYRCISTFRLMFWQFRMLPLAFKQVFGKHHQAKSHPGDISHFASLMTALSATIGTGNIAGVATACVLGGPGAVFWMWMTALFGMASKYGEGVLAVKYRVKNENGLMSGGPMYYIEKGLKVEMAGADFLHSLAQWLLLVLAASNVASKTELKPGSQAL